VDRGEAPSQNWLQASRGYHQGYHFLFWVPNFIIIDNDTQFIGEKLVDFCDNNNIRMDWAMVAHPRTNG
jgi:hypothetical protein